MTDQAPRAARLEAGVTLQHPSAFWAGTALVVAGVLAHFPTFLDSSGMGFHMRDMAMTGVMIGGMILIIAGLVLATYGLIPMGRSAEVKHRDTSSLHFQAMDSAHLTRAHWGLLFILGIALIVDVMKPATLGFVIPGMKQEYGMTTKLVALFPLLALTGTTIGSLLWGMLADRVGRRVSILLASLIFMATSICGFMPSFRWNLFMCFLMGLSAGGMLPIVYALMTESMPAKRRGWLVVLHGGMGTVGGYLVASGLATLFEPHYTWRILWFAGLPTGLIMLLLNRYIPESPRFLIDRGRVDEAERVMQRYGVTVTRSGPGPIVAAPGDTGSAPSGRPGLATLFRTPYLVHSLTVGMYGLGWGLVNWGFLTFTPTILRERGLTGASTSKLLFWSALIAVPATVLVAYLYGMWSSKKSMILFALITTAALVAFAVTDPGGNGQNTTLIMPLMVVLLIGTGGIISMLSPYTAEVYPTALRGTGSGFAAGSSKVGGILAPPLAAFILGTVPGFGLLGLVVAAPVVLSAVILAVAGVETRNRALEEMAVAPRTGTGIAPAALAE